MALSRDDILGADDLPKRAVNVPQWGGEVLIRTMNGVQREELEKRIASFKTTGKVNPSQAVRAVAAVMCCVAENGEPLFSQADTELLAKKSGAALDLVFDDILEHNGMTKRAAEELEKN